jgi:hypothetical protein
MRCAVDAGLPRDLVHDAIWGGRTPVAREGQPIDRAIHMLTSPRSCVTSLPTARRRDTERHLFAPT